MIRKEIIISLFYATLLFGCTNSGDKNTTDNADYTALINPFIGASTSTGAAGNRKDIALLSNRKSFVIWSDHFHSLSDIPNLLALFFKKSFSTLSFPI